MKKQLLKLMLPVVALSLGGLTSCSKKVEHKFIPSETLYVQKVNDMPDDFILGMDVSSVLSEEAAGVKYYNFEGEEEDLMKVLSDSGVNYIRVRVWNKPQTKQGVYYGGGNNDINAAVEIGKRATKYGMKLLVDFHYSDFWADPSKQKVPKDWKKLTYYEMKKALYEYTRDSLKLLKDNGVDVGMVQVGNESNNGLAGETDWIRITALMQRGSEAVREVYPGAKVAVHFANPEKSDNYYKYAKALSDYNVDYDVFGSSYYPYWHGTLDNLSTVLGTIADTYNKKVMVMETSYCFSGEDFDFGGNTIGETSGFDTKDYPFSIAGQTNCLRNVTDTVVHTKNGIGVCYWEGAWISAGGSNWEENHDKWEQYGCGWASEAASEYDPDVKDYGGGGTMVDNQTFFTTDGKPLESLKAFGLMRRGNEEVPTYIDGIEDPTVIHSTDEDFTLPATVNVVKNDNSKVAVPVVWEDFDIEAAKAAGNGKYTIAGVAEGRAVNLFLVIMEKNFIENYSFETGAADPWVRVPVSTVPFSNTYIVGVTNENPQTGDYAYHFWANSENTVGFEVEQTLHLTSSGTYKYQVSIMGSTGASTPDPTKQNIYAYVKINGVVAYQESGNITYYKEWHDILIQNISYTVGDEIVVGVHVESKEAGSWGDIDDCMFNFVG